MALLVTAIGEPKTFPQQRKDGSGSFDIIKVPLTLKAKFGDTSGFKMGVNYSIWLDAAKVVKVTAAAQSLIDGVATASDGSTYHPSCRLAIVNDAECFELGKLETKELQRKSDNGSYSVTNQTIWLKDPTMVLQYDILELAVHPQRGNIDDLDILVDVKGAKLLNAPVASAAPTTAVDPF